MRTCCQDPRRETRQVGGDLDGTAGGGENLDGEGGPATGDGRVDCGAVQVLGVAEMRGWSPL